MAESREFKLDSRQSSRLLDLGLCPPAGSDDPVHLDDRRKDLLYQVLATPLPLSKQTKASLPPILQGQCQDLLALAGQPVGELLQNSKVDLAVIRRIKEFAKEQGEATKSKEAQDAFMAVYLGAIAIALVFHGERISQHSTKNLKHFFGTFARKAWVLAELRPLYEQALEAII